MSQPTKRPRGDDDAAEQPTEGSAVGASASAASARPNEPAVEMLHGVAIEMSYIYTTMYHPAAVLYLLADGQVSFQQGDRPACCQHGNWAIEADQGTLRVCSTTMLVWGTFACMCLYGSRTRPPMNCKAHMQSTEPFSSQGTPQRVRYKYTRAVRFAPTFCFLLLNRL